MLVNSQLVVSYQLGLLNCSVASDLFVSKHLSGVPVSKLCKLSSLSTINKPLERRELSGVMTVLPLLRPRSARLAC